MRKSEALRLSEPARRQSAGRSAVQPDACKSEYFAFLVESRGGDTSDLRSLGNRPFVPSARVGERGSSRKIDETRRSTGATSVTRSPRFKQPGEPEGESGYR